MVRVLSSHLNNRDLDILRTDPAHVVNPGPHIMSFRTAEMTPDDAYWRCPSDAITIRPARPKIYAPLRAPVQLP